MQTLFLASVFCYLPAPPHVPYVVDDTAPRSARPPIIETSRESAEPPLLDPFAVALQAPNQEATPLPKKATPYQMVKKSVYDANPDQLDFCSREPRCICGCQSGGPCQCAEKARQLPSPNLGSGNPYRGVAAAVWPAPSQNTVGASQPENHGRMPGGLFPTTNSRPVLMPFVGRASASAGPIFAPPATRNC